MTFQTLIHSLWGAFERRRYKSYVSKSLPFAREALSDSLGCPVELQITEVFQGPIARCQVGARSNSAPESVVVKCGLPSPGTKAFDPANTRFFGNTDRFFNDWAGTRFLSESFEGTKLSPSLLAGDRQHGVLVFEYFGQRNLYETLIGDAHEPAEEGLIRFAQVLGLLQARSIQHLEDYTTLRGSLDHHPNRKGQPLLNPKQWLEGNVNAETRCRQVRENFEFLHFQPATGFDEELEESMAAMENPGPFLAYTQGDTSPANLRFSSTGEARLIDFEFGGFRHALSDGVFARMFFPTSQRGGHRIPAEIVAQAEKEYRAQLAVGCPEAGDDTIFHRALVDACAFWVVPGVQRSLSPPQRGGRRSALKRDRRSGRATLRQILLQRLVNFTEIARQLDHRPAMAETFEKLLGTLRQRWKDTPETPFYPAFRSS